MAPTAEPGLALDEQLCFAVYSASRAITSWYRPLLDELGLTYPQYLVMLVLWESGPVTVGQLGKRLRLDSGTLSPLLMRMATNGMFGWHRRADDERSVEIALTGAGHRLRERAMAIPPRVCAATGLDAGTAGELIARLRALTDEMQADLARQD